MVRHSVKSKHAFALTCQLELLSAVTESLAIFLSAVQVHYEIDNRLGQDLVEVELLQ